MQRNRSVTIVAVALLFLAIFLFIGNRIHVNRERRQQAIEAAKANFVSTLYGGDSASVDSVQVSDDTVSFYKKGHYLGKTITVTK